MEFAQVQNKLPERFPEWPEIDNPFASTLSEMFGKLICHPPLGALTDIPPTTEEVTFKVALETRTGDPSDWQVALWHTSEGKWNEAKFQSVGEEHRILAVNTDGVSKHSYYTLKFPRPTTSQASTRFTIKFRHASMPDWKWANGQFNLQDGQLCWQSTTFPSNELSYYLEGLDSKFTVAKVRSEVPDTLLFKVTIPISKADGDAPFQSEHVVGKVDKTQCWWSTVRLVRPWFAPRQGDTKFAPQGDCVQASFHRDDGLHVVMLPLSGIDATSSFFKYNDDNQIVFHASNDAPSDGFATILVAIGTSYETGNCSVMYECRNISSASEAALVIPEPPKSSEIVETKSEDPQPKWYEEWVDGFGYCTWNSLGVWLTEEKILDILKGFRDDGVTISTLIIDDNWQSLKEVGAPGNVHDRGMSRFEADKDAFPQGLGSTISKIKSQNPGLSRVSVWHTLLGYWGGMAPDSDISKEYKTVKVQRDDGARTLVAGEDVGRFYTDFYAFLRSCGVDGVKTDAQDQLDGIQHAPDRVNIIKSYQDAWMLAGLRYLSGHQIACGSMVPMIMFHSQIAKYGPRIVVRNSDDFFPHVDDSHTWHIFVNACNALLMRHLNVILDWDMFQTSHDWGYFHAAARCISGGPIYITDYPGQTNKELIKQMTVYTPRGSTTILRPSRLAKASDPYQKYDEAKLFKIDNYHGGAETGISFVGVFNICRFSISDMISLDQFPGTENGEYVIRSYLTRKTTPPVKRGDDAAYVHLDLDMRGWDVLTAFPVTALTAGSSTVRLALLGLVDKLSGGVAAEGKQIRLDDRGRPFMSTSLRGLGTLGVWIDRLPRMNLETDLFLIMFNTPVPMEYVKISDTDENVLEVDLERMWKEGDYDLTWNNEVPVQVLITKLED